MWTIWRTGFLFSNLSSQVDKISEKKFGYIFALNGSSKVLLVWVTKINKTLLNSIKITQTYKILFKELHLTQVHGITLENKSDSVHARSKKSQWAQIDLNNIF